MSHWSDLHIRQQLESLLPPLLDSLQLQGLQVEILGVEQGVVTVRLGGLCTACPSTLRSIVHTLESELAQQIPGFRYLEPVP
jgi:Fe-S cluster biogenesis protein NfuA